MARTAFAACGFGMAALLIGLLPSGAQAAPPPSSFREQMKEMFPRSSSEELGDTMASIPQGVYSPAGLRPESLIDNLSIGGYLDASKQPQDLGVNAQFGAYLNANWGFPVWSDWGLGGQIGTGVDFSHAGVRVLQVSGVPDGRQQWFNTIGLFQRFSDKWHWGAGLDMQVSDYYSTLFAGQFRGEVGMNLNYANEVGVWATTGLWGDRAEVLDVDWRLRPITQFNVYRRHTWESGAETRGWLGLAGRHGREIATMPDLNPSLTPIVPVFGLSIFVPLNDYFALTGEGNFITPSDTGTLDAYLGLIYYPNGGVRRSRLNRYAPVLPVASNPTFALDLRR